MLTVEWPPIDQVGGMKMATQGVGHCSGEGAEVERDSSVDLRSSLGGAWSTELNAASSDFLYCGGEGVEVERYSSVEVHSSLGGARSTELNAASSDFLYC